MQRVLTDGVIVVAWAQVAVGLVGYLHRVQAGLDALGYSIYALELCVFGAAAWLLLSAGRDDRTRNLGGFFLIAASAFAPSLYAGLRFSDASLLRTSGTTLQALLVDGFLPAFLWLFVADFPRTVGAHAWRRVATGMAAVSVVAGVGLTISNALVVAVGASGHEIPVALAAWSRTATEGLFWPVVFSLLLPALPFGLWRTRWAPDAERSRAFLFYGVIAAGFSPLTLVNVLEAIFPSFRTLIQQPAAFRVSQWIVYPALLAIPLATTYALLVDRVPSIGLTLRMAARYMLARLVLLTLSIVPLVALGLYLYMHRQDSLTGILAGVSPWLLIFMALLGLALLARREQMLLHLDRQFFREKYDAGEILERLIGPERPTGRAEDFLAGTLNEIDEALHPTHSVLFTTAGPRRGFLAPAEAGLPPLDDDGTLAGMLRRRPEPLSVDLRGDDNPLSRLPEPEVDWLAQGGFRILVPLVGGAGDLVAVLGLGPRRSELPYSRRDRSFLGTVGRTAGLVLERHLSGRSGGSGDTGAVDPGAPTLESPLQDGDTAGLECIGCGRLHASSATACGHCGGHLTESGVPRQLGDRYLVERRLGSGGMGVVYRAFDLDLKRRVAVKTVSPGATAHSQRIKREARAMAAVAHPNLATIYGIERWRSAWLLFIEYVDDRMLADIIADGPMNPAAALRTGEKIADALDVLHRAGFLHRDVKPSNIGFLRTGEVKLLDFGVVRIFERGLSRRDDEPDVGANDRESTTVTRLSTTAGGIVGSPLYLSPEVLTGSEPGPPMDLWALSLVLYECIAGYNPLRGKDLQATLRNVTHGRVPDLLELVPDCPAEGAATLMQALHPDPSRRFEDARALREALRAAR